MVSDARHAETLPEWVGMLGAWGRLVDSVDRLRAMVTMEEATDGQSAP